MGAYEERRELKARLAARREELGEWLWRGRPAPADGRDADGRRLLLDYLAAEEDRGDRVVAPVVWGDAPRLPWADQEQIRERARLCRAAFTGFIAGAGGEWRDGKGLVWRLRHGDAWYDREGEDTRAAWDDWHERTSGPAPGGGGGGPA